MRHQPLTAAAALLLGCNVSLAQDSTMGTTAMGLPTTPGAIVTSPLNGPSPFSAATLPGTPDTTLAPVPLASDPTTPGTVVTCATPTGQTPTGSALGSTIGPTSPFSTATTISAVPATSSTSTAANTTAMMPAISLGTILTPVVGSTTGTVSPASPLGSSSTTVCSFIPGGPSTNGAALPLSTPEIPSNASPGAIQPVIPVLGDSSIDPNLTVVPTPNSAACSQSVTMSLANPTMMAPANTTGATATPGVLPLSGR
jgi:hypothetical protein